MKTPTFDKHIGRVGVIAGLGDDTHGVHALVFLVEMDQRKGGALSGPLRVHPLGFLQRHTYE